MNFRLYSEVWCAASTAGGVLVVRRRCICVVKLFEEEGGPQLRKMADVEMDIASRRMNYGNEHV